MEVVDILTQKHASGSCKEKSCRVMVVSICRESLCRERLVWKNV
jgi:hypothetical protein